MQAVDFSTVSASESNVREARARDGAYASSTFVGDIHVSGNDIPLNARVLIRRTNARRMHTMLLTAN